MFKRFLDFTDEEIERSTTTGMVGPFAFSRAAITAFQKNELSDPVKHPSEGARKKGTLIFTGATAALRGNTTTSIFSATKFAQRSLSQSLNKEFGPQNIHVAHVSTPRLSMHAPSRPHDEESPSSMVAF